IIPEPDAPVRREPTAMSRCLAPLTNSLEEGTIESMDDPSRGRSCSPEATFLSGVHKLARSDSGGPSAFHRTRSPFTRLRDVLARMRSDHPPSHPSCCQDLTCGKPLSERYYRRADGLTLCGACFERRQAEGRARAAT
ncbi:MAG: hypothetical protein AABZ22_00290, partial [Nitrospirota bacterium]